MGPKLWSIQVLRFVAAAMVVHLHAAQKVEAFTGSAGVFGFSAMLFGRSGVDLFFVISGVIISRTAGGLGAGAFLAKRARRILPIYWLISAPLVVLVLLRGDEFGWRGALSSIALWPATDRMTAPVLGVAWTLCFEALFYLAFALVLWRRWMLGPLLAVLALGLVMPRGPLLHFVGNPLVLEFLFGVLIARLPRMKVAVWGIPVGAAVLIAGGALLWPPYSEVNDSLMGVGSWIRLLDCGVPAALIVLGALQVECKPGALTQLGDASYAIYLAHQPIVQGLAAAAKLVPGVPADLVIVLAFAVAILVGWRVHLLFEKPLQRFLALPTRRPFAATV